MFLQFKKISSINRVIRKNAASLSIFIQFLIPAQFLVRYFRIIYWNHRLALQKQNRL